MLKMQDRDGNHIAACACTEIIGVTDDDDIPEHWREAINEVDV